MTLKPWKHREVSQVLACRSLLLCELATYKCEHEEAGSDRQLLQSSICTMHVTSSEMPMIAVAGCTTEQPEQATGSRAQTGLAGTCQGHFKHISAMQVINTLT